MDKGRDIADAKLAELEVKISKEYKTAARELEKKAKVYLDKFNKQSKVMLKKVKSGDITEEEYDKWYANKVISGQRWQDLLNSMTADLVNADKLAVSMINGYLPEIYAEAINYQTYAVEQRLLLDTGFTLYNHETVAFLMKKGSNQEYAPLLPKATVDVPKDQKWNKAKLSSAITQGVLQGESAPSIAKRLQSVTDMDKSAAIRNARTMTTYAEAEGRLDSMRRLGKMGIHILKEWQSTLDGRTRHSHRLLDGERQELEDTFSNGLMEPSDPDGPAEEVYNCRCGIVAWFKELDSVLDDVRLDKEKKLGSMSYEEWKYEKQSKKNLQKVAMNYQKEANSLENAVYSNIWYNPVTVKDYANKANAIEAKREYFRNKLKDDPQNADKWNALLKLVDEYEYKGKQYVYLQERLKVIKEQLSKSAKKAVVNSAITEERRNNALKLYSATDADNALRAWSGTVWNNLTHEEKYAIYEYTTGSGSFNRPLRGYNWSWANYEGVGNVGLNNEGTGSEILDLSRALSQAELPKDMWFVRGSDEQSLAGLLEISESDLWRMSDADLKTFIGKECKDSAYMSCGSAVGTGFGGSVSYSIFIPEGTNALYIEPVSHYGGGNYHFYDWDGVSKQSYIRSECETLVNRGTYYQILDINKGTYGDINVVMQVVRQGDANDFSNYRQ